MSDTNKEIENLAGKEVTFIIPDTESLGHLKDLDATFNLRLKYKNEEEWLAIKNKPLRAYFLGLREIPNDKGENVICGLFASETEVFLSGQKVLVDAVRSLPLKTPVQITYLEKKTNKTVDGATMIFDVQLLK